MSFTGTLEKHEQIVLVRYGTGDIVDARAKADKTMRLGELALLDIDVVRGLPVESATVNVNQWNVYKVDDPALLDILLDRIFEEES